MNQPERVARNEVWLIDEGHSFGTYDHDEVEGMRMVRNLKIHTRLKIWKNNHYRRYIKQKASTIRNTKKLLQPQTSASRQLASIGLVLPILNLSTELPDGFLHVLHLFRSLGPRLARGKSIASTLHRCEIIWILHDNRREGIRPLANTGSRRPLGTAGRASNTRRSPRRFSACGGGALGGYRGFGASLGLNGGIMLDRRIGEKREPFVRASNIICREQRRGFITFGRRVEVGIGGGESARRRVVPVNIRGRDGAYAASGAHVGREVRASKREIALEPRILGPAHFRVHDLGVSHARLVVKELHVLAVVLCGGTGIEDRLLRDLRFNRVVNLRGNVLKRRRKIRRRFVAERRRRGVVS